MNITEKVFIHQEYLLYSKEHWYMYANIEWKSSMYNEKSMNFDIYVSDWDSYARIQHWFRNFRWVSLEFFRLNCDLIWDFFLQIFHRYSRVIPIELFHSMRNLIVDSNRFEIVLEWNWIELRLLSIDLKRFQMVVMNTRNAIDHWYIRTIVDNFHFDRKDLVQHWNNSEEIVFWLVRIDDDEIDWVNLKDWFFY